MDAKQSLLIKDSSRAKLQFLLQSLYLFVMLAFLQGIFPGFAVIFPRGLDGLLEPSQHQPSLLSFYFFFGPGAYTEALGPLTG